MILDEGMYVHGMKSAIHDARDLCVEIIGMCHEQQKVGVMTHGMRVTHDVVTHMVLFKKETYNMSIWGSMWHII